MDFYLNVFLFITVLSGTIIIISMVSDTLERNGFYLGIFCVSLVLLLLRITTLTLASTDLYYLEAEKYAQNDSEIIFTTEQGFYKWSTKDEMPESCYLLTMSDNNTKNTSDDEILVVWEAK